jgi:hypothetical protein
MPKAFTHEGQADRHFVQKVEAKDAGGRRNARSDRRPDVHFCVRRRACRRWGKCVSLVEARRRRRIRSGLPVLDERRCSRRVESIFGGDSAFGRKHHLGVRTADAAISIDLYCRGEDLRSRRRW